MQHSGKTTNLRPKTKEMKRKALNNEAFLKNESTKLFKKLKSLNTEGLSPAEIENHAEVQAIVDAMFKDKEIQALLEQQSSKTTSSSGDRKPTLAGIITAVVFLGLLTPVETKELTGMEILDCLGIPLIIHGTDAQGNPTIKGHEKAQEQCFDQGIPLKDSITYPAKPPSATGASHVMLSFEQKQCEFVKTNQHFTKNNGNRDILHESVHALQHSQFSQIGKTKCYEKYHNNFNTIFSTQEGAMKFLERMPKKEDKLIMIYQGITSNPKDMNIPEYLFPLYNKLQMKTSQIPGTDKYINQYYLENAYITKAIKIPGPRKAIGNALYEFSNESIELSNQESARNPNNPYNAGREERETEAYLVQFYGLENSQLLCGEEKTTFKHFTELLEKEGADKICVPKETECPSRHSLFHALTKEKIKHRISEEKTTAL